MKQVKIFDISLPISSDMLVWEGDESVDIKTEASVAKDGVALSRFSLGSHTGTHVDAPAHFIEGGRTLDSISLEKFTGICTVLDLTSLNHKEITVDEISSNNIKKNDRILFKTGNYTLLKEKTFPKEYVSLSLEAAEFLAKKEIFLVGTDFLGIEKKSNPGHPVHKALLQAGIVIVEGLNLENVPAGTYTIVCLPLHVAGADGAPARVILMQ